MVVATICGNRPQFVKAAAVSRRLREHYTEVLIHTGQHHDQQLSEVFFQELELPKPDRSLEVSGGSNSEQLARMITALEPLLRELEPQVVLVYGDTNSTLAGALVAAQLGIPVAHVEAGMRSFDRTMPEEINRVVVDHLSSLLLTPTPTATHNLKNESVAGKVVEVGDVMVDIANHIHPRMRKHDEIPKKFGLEGDYVLATAHRAGNVDSAESLGKLVDLLTTFPERIAFPLHPRTNARLESFGLKQKLSQAANITLLPPLGYMEFSALLCQAKMVLTDSGGVQKEAYLAAVPCITLRENTEWVETVQAGWNVLVGLDLPAALAAHGWPVPKEHPQLYGDGKAGERVVAALELIRDGL